MTRGAAIAHAEGYFDSGAYERDLARRVAIPSESQNPDHGAELLRYLDAEMRPTLEGMGYRCEILPNPVPRYGPFLIAERHEADDLPTVLTYGHGDVIRGQDEQWRPGLAPWKVTREDGRIYGRGTADNKGQHSINIAGLQAVLATRGRLGFNSRLLIETGEETGSPGLHAMCAAQKDRLKADVLIASDGPRVRPDRPTVYTGTRGAMNFDLTLELRAGGHHSGNWGGLLANPGIILAHALATIVSPSGQILVKELLPEPMSNSVRRALADLEIDGGEDAPEIDPEWGEPGFTAPEKVYGWNSFEILAFKTGNPDRPVNAIPPRAHAHCQMRYVVGSDPANFLPAIRRHLERHGFGQIEVTSARDGISKATRLDPDHPWVQWTVRSMAATTGKKPAILPNLGGTLPNDAFSEVLGVPTVWVPHSYASCAQHAPNEHLLVPVVREGLAIMAGLFWDLGEGGAPGR
jgi:acetylornithine deacetylase/succinyl-diaminopimelate desuccinylase-like protein